MFWVISFVCLALAVTTVAFLVKVSPAPMKGVFVVLVIALAVSAVIAGQIYVSRNNSDTYRALLIPFAVGGCSVAWALGASVLWLAARVVVALRGKATR